MTRTLLVALFCLLAMSGVATAAGFALLSEQRTVELQFVPGPVAVSPDGSGAFVASSAPEAEIVAIDREGTEERRFQLSHSAAAMLLAPDASRLFVVGESEGKGYATTIDLKAADSMAALTVAPLVARLRVPSLYLDEERTLYMADADSPLVIAMPADTFYLSPREASEVPMVGVAIYYGGGVRGLAISRSLGVAFVSGEGAARLAVVGLGGANRVYDMYGRSKSGSAMPFAMAVAEGAPNTQAGLSIAVASHETGELSIVDYNATFEALDLIATATLGHALLPNAVVRMVADTALIEQPVLLATSRTQDLILSGNRHSRQIFQYARGEGRFTNLLERIGYVELAGAPTHLAVSAAGGLAAVAMADRPQVVLLKPADDIAEPTNATMRDLQRALTELGFDVGAVDGIVGPATIAALSTFRGQAGLDFELTDTEAALAAVVQYSSGCSSRSLRCLFESR